MNDERFFDLAMKVITRQATDAERAELDALLARRPELKAEFERLQTEVRITKEALPLVNATEATAGELPAYARGRLQTKVRQTLGRPETVEKEPNRSLAWAWRWWLGLAAAAAVVVILLVPIFTTSNKPIVQLAMLDVGGATRGTDTNEAAVFREMWPNQAVADFSQAEALQAWEKAQPGTGMKPVVRVIYDRPAGEVRVHVWRNGKASEKAFPVEPDLRAALTQARQFVEDSLKRK